MQCLLFLLITLSHPLSLHLSLTIIQKMPPVRVLSLEHVAAVLKDIDIEDILTSQAQAFHAYRYLLFFLCPHPSHTITHNQTITHH